MHAPDAFKVGCFRLMVELTCEIESDELLVRKWTTLTKDQQLCFGGNSNLFAQFICSEQQELSFSTLTQ
jgi:hypothetical protein